MSRGPHPGSIRPRIAGERLTEKQRRALLLVADAGFITDHQLEALVGSYARNVITSLTDRKLIRRDRAPWRADSDWILTGRGKKIIPAVRQFADGS